MQKSDRMLARETGRTTYKGKTCKKGHDGLRWSFTGNCVACQRETNYSLTKDWKSRNLSKVRAYDSAYRARRQRALPAWLSKAQHSEIQRIYDSCPEGWEVDHVVPLGGKNVCGLHVPWNMQHLPIKLNRRKSNSFSDSPSFLG